MIAALILCAGEGRRLGGVDKAGLRLPDGRTFLDAVAATARAAGCAPVLAVGRASQAIETIINPAPERGMISSIVVGLAALAARDVAAALVWPVDQPLVTPATVAAIVAVAGPGRIVVPTYAGRGGHPTAFGRALWSELAAAATARDVVRADPARVVRLPVDDEGVVLDFDLPSDL